MKFKLPGPPPRHSRPQYWSWQRLGDFVNCRLICHLQRKLGRAHATNNMSWEDEKYGNILIWNILLNITKPSDVLSIALVCRSWKKALYTGIFCSFYLAVDVDRTKRSISSHQYQIMNNRYTTRLLIVLGRLASSPWPFFELDFYGNPSWIPLIEYRKCTQN